MTTPSAWALAHCVESAGLKRLDCMGRPERVSNGERGELDRFRHTRAARPGFLDGLAIDLRRPERRQS